MLSEEIALAVSIIGRQRPGREYRTDVLPRKVMLAVKFTSRATGDILDSCPLERYWRQLRPKYRREVSRTYLELLEAARHVSFDLGLPAHTESVVRHADTKLQLATICAAVSNAAAELSAMPDPPLTSEHIGLLTGGVLQAFVALEPVLVQIPPEHVAAKHLIDLRNGLNCLAEYF